jgi:class 3 adenylate cyclase
MDAPILSGGKGDTVLLHPTAGLLLEDGSFVPLKTSFCLGRSPECDLVLDRADRRISHRHAALHQDNAGRYWISDLGGPNGVYVDGRRIAAATPLRHGALIRIVDRTLRFLQPEGHPTPHPEQDPDRRTDDPTLPMGFLETRWLLVADIQGAVVQSTQLPPEQYVQQIDNWMRASRAAAIERTGGTVNDLTGDGFLASWTRAEGDVARISRALERFEAMRQYEPFRFRLAVHVGEVMVGGWSAPGQERLSGREVNFVFRMEKAAAALGLGVLVSRAAAEPLKPALHLRPVGPVTIRDYPAETEFFTLGE